MIMSNLIRQPRPHEIRWYKYSHRKLLHVCMLQLHMNTSVHSANYYYCPISTNRDHGDSSNNVIQLHFTASLSLCMITSNGVRYVTMTLCRQYNMRHFYLWKAWTTELPVNEYRTLTMTTSNHATMQQFRHVEKPLIPYTRNKTTQAPWYLVCNYSDIPATQPWVVPRIVHLLPLSTFAFVQIWISDHFYWRCDRVYKFRYHSKQSCIESARSKHVKWCTRRRWTLLYW